MIETLDILYEDDYLIVINKKSGQIVQQDKSGEKPLTEIISEYITKEKNISAEKVFVGLIHRIDRPVSGACMFAKTPESLAQMNLLWTQNKVKKTYWAVTRNRPNTDEGTLVHFLNKNESKNITSANDNSSEHAQRAVLNYKIISEIDNYFLWEIDLKTGRHHQIRAQLGKIGCPVIGDNKYGYKRGNRDRSIHLHARKLEFLHPVTKTKITVIAALPDDVIWNRFKEQQ